MRLFFVLMGLVPALIWAQPQPDSLRAAFRRQLDRSQARLRVFEKTIEEDGIRETKRFSPQRSGGLAAGQTQLQLADELEPALKLVFADPRLRGEYQISRTANHWKALRKPRSAPVDLIEQEIRYEDRRLRFIRSTYHYDSFLYDIYQTLEVEFDAQGNYLRHHLSERTVVSLLGIDFRIQITGAAVY